MSFDIGGRDGYSALVIAKRTRADVLSFECELSGIRSMELTFKRNDLPIRAVQAFVGSPNNAQSTMSVDEAAQTLFSPDFLKIDVEGGEADVLEGAREVLRNKRPSMIIEVHGVPAEKACLERLATHNYSVAIIDRTTFLPEQRPLPHNRWLVCTPR
jgi:hypothetical protein